MLTDHSTPLEASVGVRNFAFLNLLRGAAVLLVVYDHLGAVWPEREGRSWIVNRVVRRWVSEPLGIIQDFGFFGVALFFLVSGFVITHVAQRESRFQFATKRIFRIYPPLILSILLLIALGLVRGDALLSPGDYLRSFTLVNYFQVPQVVVQGVAWTLVIEMLFYAVVFATLPLLKSRPALTCALTLAGVALGVWQSREFGASFFLVASSVAFLPYLLLGQLVYLRWARRIGVGEFAVLTGAAYVVALFGIRRIHTAFLPADNSYMISVGFAFAVFVAALALEDSIRVPRSLSFVSDVSYSLYLLHGVVGFFVLDQLVGRISFTAALVVAFAAGLGAAYVAHRFVERPSQQVARWVISRRAREKVAGRPDLR